MTTNSLREQILVAKDRNEMEALLELGASAQYAQASRRTQNRWMSAARKRRTELKAGQ